MKKPKKPHGMPIPENPAYNFEAFIGRVKRLDLPDMIVQANAACASAEAQSFGTGGPKAREQGSVTFVARLKDLLFFLSQGRLPASMFSDRHYYREIAESLIAKGQLKKSVLEQFNT